MSPDPRPRVTRADLESHIAWRQLPAQRGVWTPARDLLLAEALAQGRGAARAADALGLDVAEVRARWDQIFPPALRGVTWQPVLLEILRANAEAARLRVVS